TAGNRGRRRANTQSNPHSAAARKSQVVKIVMVRGGTDPSANGAYTIAPQSIQPAAEDRGRSFGIKAGTSPFPAETFATLSPTGTVMNRILLTLFALFALLALRPALASDDYQLTPDSMPQPGVPKGEVTHHQWKSSAVFPGTVHDYA